MTPSHGHLAEQFASSAHAGAVTPLTATHPFTLYANAQPNAPLTFDAQWGCWIVSRYRDIKNILLDVETFAPVVPHSAAHPHASLFAESGSSAAGAFAELSPGDHTRLRAVVSRAFSPRQMNAFEPRVRAIVDRLVNAFADAGHADLANQLAVELPALVLFKLLGIPEHDIARVRQWEQSRLLLKWGSVSAEEQMPHAQNLIAYGEYVRDLVAQRMNAPQDDFPSELARLARADPAAISQSEIVSLCCAQLIAGHETLLNRLGGGLQTLLAQPEQWETLAHHPVLIPNAVEELLRCAPSEFAWRRRTTKPVTLDGAELPAGAELLLALGAANHDAAIFQDADVLDVRRKNAREHLAFGQGSHYCLGAPLARLLLRVTLEELTHRLPRVRRVERASFAFAPPLPFLPVAHLYMEWDTTARRRALTPRERYILPFEQCEKSARARVGGKCASLGAMMQAGAPVPPGFAVTTDAYARILATNSLGECIHGWLERLDPAQVREEESVSRTIRQLIEEMPLPPELEQALRDAYADLCEQVGVPDVPVAVRSSATDEDLPGASFAGLQDTYLWVVGADAVVELVRKCWSSLYSARAISYRYDHGFPHEKVLMSVAVQKMVNASSAGVAMTLNPINGDRSKIVIDASWGLGEMIVGGNVTPDNFVVDKVLLELVNEKISDKQAEMVADAAGRRVVEREIHDARRTQPSLTRAQVLAVAKIAKRAEQFYGVPQDVEWAIDADLPEPNNVIVLQSRPETVWSQKQKAAPRGDFVPQFGIHSVLNTLMAPLAKKKDS
jgi:pyruvate,water dikinase